MKNNHVPGASPPTPKANATWAGSVGVMQGQLGELNNTTPGTDAQSDRALLPQFRNRRAFLIWALMAGYTKPERVVERVVAELKQEIR
jgi:hypothetical protein